MPFIKKYSDEIILLLVIIILILVWVIVTDRHVAAINREIKQTHFHHHQNTFI